MRALILALLVGTAQAQSILWSENADGGKIVLQDDMCYSFSTHKYYPSLYAMYTYNASGTSIRGCWAIEDGMIHVVWEQDGSESRFPVNRFKKTAEFK